MSTTVDYNDLEQACYDADLDPDTAIHGDYSGRCMLGETCLGIIHDTLDELLAFVAALAENGVSLRGACQDGMGTGTITYWPSYSVGGAPVEVE